MRNFSSCAEPNMFELCNDEKPRNTNVIFYRQFNKKELTAFYQ